MKRFLLATFVTLTLLGIGFSQSAYSVLPPSVYEERIEKSKVKAVGLVKIIELIEKDPHKTKKKVTFELLKAYIDDVPQEFTGTCYSVDEDTQEPMEGPLKYYYPEVGDEAYVTISEDGGCITSYQKMNKELEKKLTDKFPKDE